MKVRETKVVKKNRASKNEENRKNENELLNSIKKLELFSEEVFENHKRKIAGEITILKEALSAKAKIKEETKRKIITNIETLKIKPKKGRAKDLIRIEKLLKELLALFPEKEN
ncbi:MAG: hypothetical protein N2445_04230 [Acidobacteria bacterium]|nr:hypothetical protein [Acidobacteriota bacterium]